MHAMTYINRFIEYPNNSMSRKIRRYFSFKELFRLATYIVVCIILLIRSFIKRIFRRRI